METVKESKNNEEDEDDVPDLIGTNFEEASKQQWEAQKAVSLKEAITGVMSI